MYLVILLPLNLMTFTHFELDAYVTYTLGAIPSGMGGDQLKQLQAAKDAGLDLDATLLMTMNFGTGDNVAAAQSSIAGGAKQIASIFSINLDDATKRTGMVPAIGVDDSKVVLDLNGAKSRESNFSVSC
jgi:hypothetical protein